MIFPGEEWRDGNPQRQASGKWHVEIRGQSYLVTSPGGFIYTIPRAAARDRMSVTDCSREVEIFGAVELAQAVIRWEYHRPNRLFK